MKKFTCQAFLWIALLALPTGAMAQSAKDYHRTGLAKFDRGDFDGTVADLTREISLGAANSATFDNRGLARVQTRDVDGALADLNRASQLAPQLSSVYASRAMAHLLHRDWNSALEDFDRSSAMPNQDYPHVYAWLIRARLGETETANRELASYFRQRGNTGHGYWVTIVAGFLLGNISEHDLFAAAREADAMKETDRLCEAWYYIGMKRLLAGDSTAAVACFRNCLGTQRSIFFAYHLAGAELKALSSDEAGKTSLAGSSGASTNASSLTVQPASIPFGGTTISSNTTTGHWRVLDQERGRFRIDWN